MSKHRSPRKWNRGLCNVPTDNHEVTEDDGPWTCHGCDFIGDQRESTAHIIENQFDQTPSLFARLGGLRAPVAYR